MRNRAAAGVGLLVALVATTSGCAWITRASVDADGQEAHGSSDAPVLSHDGRLVAFSSTAADLVPDDTNAAADVFVRDNRTGAVERVSVDSAGTEADDASSAPSISEDGRFVAFASDATNLVVDDLVDETNVYVHDRMTGATTLVGAGAAPDLSATGRYVAYARDDALTVFTTTLPLSYVYDRDTGTTTVVHPNGPPPTFTAPWGSGAPSISDDGRYVAFEAYQPGGGPQSPWVPSVWRQDLQTGATQGVAPGGADPAISANGGIIAYVQDPFGFLGTPQVYVARLALGVHDLVSVDDAGDPGDLPSVDPSISDDGRRIAFTSSATDLVADDTNGLVDVFVHDRVAQRTTIVSRDTLGAGQSDGHSSNADVADGGRYVAFSSSSTNLVEDDANGALDVFVRAEPRPVITAVTPATVARGAAPTVTVTGRNFLAPPNVGVTGAGVQVDSVVRVSETELVVQLSVAGDAAPGQRSVIVVNHGTGPGPIGGTAGICQMCLTVT